MRREYDQLGGQVSLRKTVTFPVISAGASGDPRRAYGSSNPASVPKVERSGEDDNLKVGLVAALPALRAFARSLSLDPHRADDLVQETALKAWSAREQFVRGTNLQAWLFTILRNAFFTDCRRMRREVEDPDGHLASELAIPPPQDGALEGIAFRSAFARLTPLQREILILVGAEGRSYAETAEICGVRLGTVKSRIHRARLHLAARMGFDPSDLVSSSPRQG